MLSRPSSFSIRRLISQKKPDQSEDDGLHVAYGAQDGSRDSTDGAKSKTWPKGNRKGPIPTIDIRKSEDIHRIVVLPPLPDTPKSWTSSVLSYDDDKSFSSPRSSPTPPTEKRFPRSPIATPQRSPQRSPLLNPKQCEFPQRIRSRSLGPPSPGPLLPYSPPSSPRTLPRNEEESPICPVDIADAYFSVPQTKEKLWAGEPLSSGRSRPRGYSDDVQQLIRETDEAFRLRHSFSGAKLPSPRTPRAPIAAGGPVLAKSSTLPRRPSQRSARSSTWSKKAQKKASIKIPVIVTPAVSPSAVKTKKKQVKKQPSRRTRSTSAPASAPRWTLTESAKDLFNIRIFNKIEADEVLPESVLHEIRMSRATQARLAKEAKADANKKQKISGESSTSDLKTSRGIDGGIERTSTESTTRAQSPTPSQGDLKDRSTADDSHRESPVDVAVAYLEDEATFPVVSATDDQPTTLAKSKLAKPPPRRKHMPLPTIPEIITSSTENVFLSPTSRRKGASSTDEYIYYDSTPFTLTVPTFQHGRIRMAKKNLPINQLATAVDDTLDWTAFQMAIIGGAGDFFGEATDYSRPSDAELDERDELATWFSEFGLDGPGALVPAAEALRLYRREAEAASRASAPSLAPPPVQPPAPVSPPTPTPEMIQVRRPNMLVTAADKSLPQRLSSLAWRVDPPPPPFPGHAANNYMISTTGIGAGQEGVGNWPQYLPPPQYQSRGSYVPPSSFPRSLDGVPKMSMKKYPGHRISTDSEKSLPQSPMQELVISRDSAGNEYVVPMGFNLGHDLGDFLRWEAEHVFGGGYYDPGPEVS